MLSEIVAATELSLAQGATKRFVAGMGSSVARQVFNTPESFRTIITT